MYIWKIAFLGIDKCFPVGTWNKSQAKIIQTFAAFKFISPPWSGFTLSTQLKMLLFRTSMTSMFLNSKGNYHCSLWPNSNSWPSSLKYFLPSLSRTACRLCFLFYVLGFSTQSFGDTPSLSVGVPQRKNTLDLFTIWTLYPVSCLQILCFGCPK